ncbi:Chalcone_isomerase domain-containing protein [Rubrivivax sp. A210]|uniref:chalcone isomerase family protein n=1 Tax=Rubrivivax sp. A210 TaxID=2772301 RepID=UPI00191A7996|nr:chalcone isomerase family protein [Rubrivivax sp. A210]CAD5374940.1 Chalcone_isomerase domain-containing protein [Rubrivivax sp. A210]
MKSRILLLATLMAATSASAQPQPIELAGVRHPPTMTVGGKDLLLNGAGIRYKFVVKVYTAGLYLGARASTPAAVLASPGPRRLHVTMLRAIDANELGRLFTRGLQDNAPKEEFSRLIPGTLRMSEIFSARKKLAAGDSFSVDWLPGAGTVILVNGQPQGEPVKEPEFYNALLRIWLGASPADWLLKDALLGRAAPSPGGSGEGQ